MLFHGIYDVFAIGSKNHCIYSIFEPHLAKALVFTQSSSCCKKYFPPHNGVGFLFLILNPSRPPPPPPPHLSHTSLSHTISHASTLSHTIFHTQLCHTHTQSFTHNFVTHTIFHTHLCHTPSHMQAWHLGTFTFVLPGTWRHRPSFRVTGVALMALGWLWWCAGGCLVARWRRGTFRGRQRLATSTVVLRGRRGA